MCWFLTSFFFQRFLFLSWFNFEILETILAFPRSRHINHETKHNQNKTNYSRDSELLELDCCGNCSSLIISPDSRECEPECRCHSFPSDLTSPPRQKSFSASFAASSFRQSFLPHSQVHHHRQILRNGGPLPFIHHRLPNRLQDRIPFSTLNSLRAQCNSWVIPAGPRKRRSVQNVCETQLKYFKLVFRLLGSDIDWVAIWNGQPTVTAVFTVSVRNLKRRWRRNCISAVHETAHCGKYVEHWRLSRALRTIQAPEILDKTDWRHYFQPVH